VEQKVIWFIIQLIKEKIGKKFKSPVPASAYGRKLELNKDGFFVPRYNYNNTFSVYRSTDFGVSWKVDTCKILYNNYEVESLGFFYEGNKLCIGFVDKSSGVRINSHKFENNTWIPLVSISNNENISYRSSINRYWRTRLEQNKWYLDIYDLTSQTIIKSIVEPRADDAYFKYIQDSIILIGHKDSCFVSHNLGETWIKNKKTIPNETFSVKMIGNGIYCFNNNNIYKTIDFGKTWTSLKDTIIGEPYNNFVNTGYSQFTVKDSTISVLNGSIFFTRQDNDLIWQEVSTNSALMGIRKLGNLLLRGDEDDKYFFS
jgi:hypothetical protein